MAAVLEGLGLPAVHVFELIRTPSIAGWPAASEVLSFGSASPPAAPADLSAAAIDAFIEDILGYYRRAGVGRES